MVPLERVVGFALWSVCALSIHSRAKLQNVVFGVLKGKHINWRVWRRVYQFWLKTAAVALCCGTPVFQALSARRQSALGSLSTELLQITVMCESLAQQDSYSEMSYLFSCRHKQVVFYFFLSFWCMVISFLYLHVSCCLTACCVQTWSHCLQSGLCLTSENDETGSSSSLAGANVAL